MHAINGYRYRTAEDFWPCLPFCRPCMSMHVQHHGMEQAVGLSACSSAIVDCQQAHDKRELGVCGVFAMQAILVTMHLWTKARCSSDLAARWGRCLHVLCWEYEN